MNRIACLFATAAALILTGPCAVLAEGSPDDVLVETSLVKLTRGDYEADLQGVPPEMRNAFASNPTRISKLLNNLLITKTLAAEARLAGADRDPQGARLVGLEGDRVLAQAQTRRLEEAAGAEFDAKQAQFLRKAREAYLLDKDKYRVPEQVQAAHILFDTRENEPDAALARAKAARDQLLAGADFTALAKELSDDPAAKSNGGEMGWIGPDRREPEFTKAAFGLNSEGDISEPVRSSIGYHLIRLEGRRAARQMSFDEVKDQIMTGLRTRYVNEQREAKLASIRTDPNMKVNQEAVDALVYRVDAQIFRQALPQSK
jgi:parvulin-like peptidyl-prolyl isomerase